MEFNFLELAMVKKFLLFFLVLVLLMVSVRVETTYAVIFTVNASVSGGHGTVTPLTQKIKPNARATITIKPDTGYHLDTITDNGVKMKLASPYAIPIVTEDHQVEFTFAINTYAVNASVSGGHGKVDPATQTLPHGEKATITITPDEGYKITGILDNGNSIGIANPLILNNVTAAHSLVIAFTTFTVTATAGIHGSVSPATQTVQSGGKATIKITPDVGYMIEKILDNDKEVKIANPYVITGVTANRKIMVSFTTAVLTIKATVAGGHGSISPEVSQVLYGGTLRLTITPDDGYHITGLTDNGSVIPSREIIYIRDITIDHAIQVSFIEFTISTRMIDDHGSITPLKQTIFYGGTATLTIKSDPGYKPSYLIDNGSWKSPTTPTTYVIKNVTEDHFVELAYVGITFTVTAIVAGGFGKVEPTKQTVKYGSQCFVTMIPDRGYKITGIMDNGKAKIASSPYLIRSVTEDHTVIITYLTYAVFASVSGGHGMVTPANQYLNAGSKASIIIIPETGYHIDKILDNDKPMPIKAPYVIPNVLENHGVVLSFAINTYTVTSSVVGGHGTITPATQTVSYGGRATLAITPEKGYKIESITDNGLPIPIENPCDLYYITANHTIVVKFSLKK
jgi:hypothetical protein